MANRPVTDEQVAAVVARIEDRLRRRGPRVTSERVGVEILGQLARLDEVAYLRFASVYKGFEDLADFEREVGLLQKTTAPKPCSDGLCSTVKSRQPCTKLGADTLTVPLLPLLLLQLLLLQLLVALLQLLLKAKLNST